VREPGRRNITVSEAVRATDGASIVADRLTFNLKVWLVRRHVERVL
jgi:hypothetical protein